MVKKVLYTTKVKLKITKRKVRDMWRRYEVVDGESEDRITEFTDWMVINKEPELAKWMMNDGGLYICPWDSMKY